MTTITLPASQKEIDAVESSLAMPESEIILRSFSLCMKSGDLQRMIGQKMTLSEINDRLISSNGGELPC